MTPCPDIEKLQQFLREELTGQESSEVSAHLDGCARCEEAVAQLVGVAHFPPLEFSVDSSASEGLPSIPGYDVLGKLGQGGMGLVLWVRDPSLGRPLALKVLHERYRADPGLQQRFVEEAKIAGQLQHPGIAPVHQLGVLRDMKPSGRTRSSAKSKGARKKPWRKPSSAARSIAVPWTRRPRFSWGSCYFSRRH